MPVEISEWSWSRTATVFSRSAQVGTRSRVGQLVVCPCPVESLNLEIIHTLRDRWPNRPIGYSGLERSLGDGVKRVYDSDLPSRRSCGGWSLGPRRDS
ncbi:MAG: hypothetical protein M3495_12815 [Pseudomonadota bacterium]|nr:hypothetical protein [Gammaproteobacteria bacterium]MDQ3582421.1 hypothetical protein [Pseudomonadota bacterium]